MHEVPNVYVVDGSAFPTATEKNPTLTILALSWRATDHLAERAEARRLTPCKSSRAPKVYPVIVIGSGAAGGMAAWNLTQKGVQVLMLDAGDKFDRGKFWTHVRPWEARERRAKGEAPQQFFLDTKEQPYKVPEGKHFDLTRVWGLGGKTNVWGRVSLRLSEMDFKAADQRRLGDPVADLLRRHLALLRQGRADDRRLRRRRRFGDAAGQQVPAAGAGAALRRAADAEGRASRWASTSSPAAAPT